MPITLLAITNPKCLDDKVDTRHIRLVIKTHDGESIGNSSCFRCPKCSKYYSTSGSGTKEEVASAIVRELGYTAGDILEVIES